MEKETTAIRLNQLQLSIVHTMKWRRNTVKIGFPGVLCGVAAFADVALFLGGGDGVEFPIQGQLYT